MWLVPSEELTLDQTRAVEMPTTEHRVVLGGPGSGKTLVLAHRAKYLMDTYRVPPERLRVFVYTNALKQYIQAGINFLEIPEENVIVFDSWCRDFFDEQIGGSAPWDEKKRTPDFQAIRRVVLNKIKTDPRQFRLFDFVMVDEGQDLETDAFEILKRISNHVTVCMDHKQQIYDHGSTEKEVLKALGLPRRNMILLETFRCCPYIVHLAATLIPEPAERTAYRNQARTDSRGREIPVLYRASSTEEEKRRLLETVRARQQAGEKVAVLLPTNRLTHGYAEALREAGLEVESPKRRGAEDGPYDWDFRSDRTKVMTYPSAKGLTFDTVIMPRLVERPFDWLTPGRITNLLFVGISRAVKWVYLSTVDGMELPQVETLQSAAREGSLTIRKDNSIPKATAQDRKKPSPQGISVPVAPADDLSYLF